MFNKYAELRKIALLYTACRGLLRIKMAADTYSPEQVAAFRAKDFDSMSEYELMDLLTQNTQGMNASTLRSLRNRLDKLQTQPQPGTPTAAAGGTPPAAAGGTPPAAGGTAPTGGAPTGGTAPTAGGGPGGGTAPAPAGGTAPAPAGGTPPTGGAPTGTAPAAGGTAPAGGTDTGTAPTTPTPTAPTGGSSTPEASPLPMTVNRGMSSAQAMAAANKRMAASGEGTAAQPQQQRRPTSPLQQRQMSRQQYMQNHQKQIQQAGQQAQQNATKGFFGRALNWLTGGGYGGWAAGRAQAQQQKQLNQRYDQQGAQLKANQQKARQRMEAAQFQKFMMSRQPAATAAAPAKAAGYSLLNLFPGYQQLFNYV